MRRPLFATFPRPTRSAAWLLLVAAILELLGHLISSSGVTIAASMALGAILGDAVLIPRIDRLDLSRNVAARLTVGVPTRVQVSISTSGRRRLARRPVVVIDAPQGLPERRIVVPPIADGRTAVASYDATPEQRGFWAEPGSVLIEGFSPLGGFVRRRRLPVGESTWVHPRPALPLRLPEAMSGQALGATAISRSGAGVDIFGVRDWRSGDPAASIHWRASAKRDRLVVLEREQPSNTALLVVLSDLMNTGVRPDQPGAVEHLVARCGATALAARRARRRVTLVGAHRSLEASTATEILDWFAQAPIDRPVDVDALDSALRNSGLGATVVWLAGSPPSAEVRRRMAAVRVGAVVTPSASATQTPGRTRS